MTPNPNRIAAGSITATDCSGSVTASHIRADRIVVTGEGVPVDIEDGLQRGLRDIDRLRQLETLVQSHVATMAIVHLWLTLLGEALDLDAEETSIQFKNTAPDGTRTVKTLTLDDILSMLGVDLSALPPMFIPPTQPAPPTE